MAVHIDEMTALAQSAHRDAEIREQLFQTLFEQNGEASKNAVWTLTHLPDSDNVYINAHRDELVGLALVTHEIPLRRMTLTLLERLEWEQDDIRTDLLDFCLEHMMLVDEPYGVKALCIKLAYLQCRYYPELKEELRQCLLLMEPTELGAGVKHTRG